MAPPTVRTLQRLAAETGYRLDTLEKVLRLLELLDEIAEDPVLSQRLALKGGTALNVFYLDLDRLSVDIDLNYVGALDLAAMERECPEVDAAIDRLFASHGYGVRRRPTGYAGGKWLARYASALGGNASLELDLNYMTRQLLCNLAICLPRDLVRDAGDVDTWIAQSVALWREGLAFLFEWSENERSFLDGVLDRGEVNANLLGVEREVGARIFHRVRKYGFIPATCSYSVTIHPEGDASCPPCTRTPTIL